MARKPNFRFERQERERVHAEKRAARDALKEQRKAETEGTAAPASEPAADGVALQAPTAAPTPTPVPGAAPRTAPSRSRESIPSIAGSATWLTVPRGQTSRRPTSTGAFRPGTSSAYTSSMRSRLPPSPVKASR